MKKYKSNHMVTIMFQLCNMFLITFPGVFIMWLLFNQDDQQGVLYIFPTYGLLILFFIVLGNRFFYFSKKNAISPVKILFINVQQIIWIKMKYFTYSL